MEFNDYQKRAWETAIYPNKGSNITYPALGLAGETGEICEKIKKIIRDDGGKVSNEKKELLNLKKKSFAFRRWQLTKEMGDVFWYLASLGVELGLHLDDIAQANIDKLHGSGDER